MVRGRVISLCSVIRTREHFRNPMLLRNSACFRILFIPPRHVMQTLLPPPPSRASTNGVGYFRWGPAEIWTHGFVQSTSRLRRVGRDSLCVESIRSTSATRPLHHLIPEAASHFMQLQCLHCISTCIVGCTKWHLMDAGHRPSTVILCAKAVAMSWETSPLRMTRSLSTRSLT